jgi:hypothetical protein
MTPPRRHSRRTLRALVGVLAALALADADSVSAQHGLRRMPPGLQQPLNVAGSEFVAQQITRPGTMVPTTQIIGPMTTAGLGYSTQSGIQLSISFDWQPGYGYVPILFRASSAQAAKRDRSITIRLHTNVWSSAQTLSVEEAFPWPKDATSIDASMLVPRYTDWQGMSWEVLVNGRPDPQLAAEGVQVPATGAAGEISILTIVENALHHSGYETLLRDALGGVNMGYNAIPAAELPTDWIGYTSVDVVILPLDEFAALLDNQPQQAAALLRWVRAGGNLWIEDVGRQWERLAALERLLRLPKDAADGVSAEPRRERGWHWPTVEDQAPSLADGVVELLSTKKTNETPASSVPPIPRQSQPPPPPPPSKTLAVRRYGMGMIAAFQRSLAAESPGTHRAALLQRELRQSLVTPRLTWAIRHGNVPDNSNFDFNNFLIPGVGLAPVGQFQFLITLFVIGIGPLNYWLLKRKNKLPLLLVTVPAAAAATTLLLFGYGILADGFSTRVRVRSITLLDQNMQEAATWARLSYYAGIAPRDGLVMPRDAALYPILPRWDRRLYSRSGIPRDLRWQANEQDLTRGWLASRTPTQYLQIAARPSTKRLDMRAADAGLTVVNRLGVAVTHLAVQDHAGRIYWGESLAPGERQVLPAVERNIATGAIRRLFTENLPEFPGDYVAQSSGMYYSQSMYELGLSHNLMEAELAAVNSALVDSWPDGSYIAFTATGVEVAIGVEGAAEEASFHVIRGSW